MAGHSRWTAEARGYLVAVAATAGMVLLRWLLDPVMGDNLPLVTLYGSVAAAVWYGGYRPAVLATVLGFVACNYLFMEPRGTLAVQHSHDHIGFALYLFTCSLVIGFGEALRLAQRREQRERELLRVTFASMGDAVITTDGDGRVTSLNAVAEALTGWTQTEAVGRPLDAVFRLVNEQTRLPVENPVRKVLADGEMAGLANHTVLIAKDGTERPIDDSAAPIRDAAGVVRGVVLIFRDVTERRKADATRNRLAVIVEGSNDAIIGKGLDGTITSWNRGAERLFGYSAAEVIGRSVAILAPPDRADEMPAILARLKQGGRVEHFDTVRRAKDGRLVPISLTVSPINDADGDVVGASKIARDISERKRAEEALHEEKERLRVTLASIGDAVITTDVEGRIAYLNAVAESLTGWTQGEAVGQPLDAVFHIVHEETRKGVESPATKALKEGVIVGLANHTVLLRKDGTERPIDDSASPIRDGRGHVVGCVLVFRDIAERRRADGELRRAEERVRSVVETVIDGIVTIDEGGTVETFNPAAERLFGYPASEVIGRNVKVLMPDPFHGEHDGYLANYLRTGEAKVIGIGREVVGRRKDGSTFPMELAVSEFSLRGRRHFTGIVRDITERKKAEGQLRHERERLDVALAAGRMGVYEWNPVDRVTWWSPEVYAMHGVSPESFNPTDGVQLVHPDDLEKVMDIPRAIEERRPWIQEFRIVRPNGEVRWVSGRAETEYDTEGRGRRFYGVISDITERHQKEAELQASEARFRQLAEAMPQIVWVAGPSGQYVYVNRHWSEYTGRTNEEGLGDGWAESVHPDDLPGVRAEWEGCVRDGRPYTAEYRMRGKGGEYRWHVVRGIPITDDGGRVVCWYGSSTDIDEPKRLAETLREADRRKDEFLATLAHELRNPLAPVRNALHLLRQAEGDGGAVEHARSIMDRQVSQMTRLVDDLLDVARISRGKLELRRQRVELAAVVDNAVETSRPLIDQMGHALAVTVPPRPVYLDLDPVRVTQVLLNLLNNAAKYTEPGGRIWLTAERHGSDAVVTVRDTGVGIPADKLPHVFDMFTQVEGSAGRSQGGLGLGLTLVKRLTEMHGGSVEARSDGPGRGSEFTVRLPVALGPGPGEPPSGGAAVAPRRILVVDDNRDGADTFATVLELLGHDVRTAYDGVEAVQAAEAFRPDVALLDIGLPRLNGREAARRIRQQPWGERMVLIAVTGWGQEEDKRLSQEAGFNFHMIKPVDPQSLTKLLAELLPAPADVPA